MVEKITVYNIDQIGKAKPADRDEFYEQQIKNQKEENDPTEAVGVVQILLFNTSGDLILQKRSHTKAHNPYLIDKSIGGHIPFGDSPAYTAMIETVQEMRVPSIVLQSNESFERTISLIDGSLESVAVLELIDEGVHKTENILKSGERYLVAKRMYVYLGLYSGPIKPVDREASGILYYDLGALADEMERSPDLFTPDLHFMMKKYKRPISEFLKKI